MKQHALMILSDSVGRSIELGILTDKEVPSSMNLPTAQSLENNLKAAYKKSRVLYTLNTLAEVGRKILHRPLALQSS